MDEIILYHIIYLYIIYYHMDWQLESHPLMVLGMVDPLALLRYEIPWYFHDIPLKSPFKSHQNPPLLVFGGKVQQNPIKQPSNHSTTISCWVVDSQSPDHQEIAEAASVGLNRMPLSCKFEKLEDHECIQFTPIPFHFFCVISGNWQWQFGCLGFEDLDVRCFLRRGREDEEGQSLCQEGAMSRLDCTPSLSAQVTMNEQSWLDLLIYSCLSLYDWTRSFLDVSRHHQPFGEGSPTASEV